jgi:uncharacterized protein involved in exopolysaccharide biosynthesis
MNSPLRILTDELRPMEAHRIVARYTLSALWQGKWCIAAIVTLCFVVAAGGVALIPPYYTSEAILQLSFSREEPAEGLQRVVATLDASAMMESEVRLIRSLAIARAVVTRLGLENSPELTRRSRLSGALLWLQTELGIASVPLTKYDLAVAALMRRVRVEIQGRSYLLSIIATSNAPTEASTLANAIATEYLRTTAMREVGRQAFSAQAELTALASVYGKRHPNFQRGALQLERIRHRLDALPNAQSAQEIMAIAGGGPTLIPANTVLAPSGPNIKLILGAAGFVGVLAGMFLVLHRRRLGQALAETQTRASQRAQFRQRIG